MRLTRACRPVAGRVIVPAGEFLTGANPPERRREFAPGQRMPCSNSAPIPKAYLPAVFTRFEGTECYNYSPLIYALGQKNVAVTGEGTLDGQADESNWLAWKRNGTAAARNW